MILAINTAKQNSIFVGLFKEGSKVFLREMEIAVEFHESEKLLALIDGLLKKAKVAPQALTGIIVVNGPGSFTALRIGVTVANTFSYVLNIPAAGIKLTELDKFTPLEIGIIKLGESKLKKAKIGELVMPFYGAEPKISKPKKK